MKVNNQFKNLMCGVAGIYHYKGLGKPVDRELLMKMTLVLRHRGPDDYGYYINDSIGIGLGHRRLSIIDLSSAGQQPIPNEDSKCWITYNGEIYNHKIYRRELESRGHLFRGTSDAETLLHLLEERGPACLADLYGIFAFAFWDEKEHILTLARDPLGVKQLYYYDDGTSIIFANEIKAILEFNKELCKIDNEAINQYLHFHTTLFDKTFFRDIKQLRAGEFLQITRKGDLRKIYWQVKSFESRGGSPEANVKMLSEQLALVIDSQLMADVPVGSFFSGGINSSTVAAFAKQAGKPPACFGIYFNDKSVIDERPFQEASARSLGLELHLTTIDGSTFPDDLMRLIYFQDEPVIGAAMFPMYYVSKLASDHVKVCLGGREP